MCLLVAALGLLACAAPPPPSVPTLSWPPVPEPTRLRYLGSLRTPEDVQGPRSWLGRVWELLVGAEDVRIQRPYGLAAGPDGRVYVADSTARVIHVFDPRQQKYRFIAEPGGRPFRMPIGVAVADDDTVYVSDAELRTVLEIDARGRLVREMRSGLERPAGLALSPNGEFLFVADTHGHRVAVFDRGGRLVRFIGERGAGPAEFNFPTNVAVDREGALYVADTMNFRVVMLGPDGSPRGVFGKLGDGSGDMSRPKGLGVDSDGHVWVVEGLHDIIQAFDIRGRLLLDVGGTGTGPGSFWLPTGLHIDREDKLYVADTYNGRVQMFKYVREGPR